MEMPSLKRRRHKTPVPLGFDIKTDEDTCDTPAKDKQHNSHQQFMNFSKNQLEFLVVIGFATFAIVVLLTGIVLAIIYFATYWDAVQAELVGK